MKHQPEQNLAGAKPAAAAAQVPLIEPYWLWSRPALLPPLPPLSPGWHQADVAIIGGGLAGLSAAYHLLRHHPEKTVLVLEADRLGSGASARSTGMLSPGVGQSLSSLVRRLGPDSAAALYRQTLSAVQAVRQLIADEGIDCQLHMGGQTIYARHPRQRLRLAAQAALMQELGLGHAVEALSDAAFAARLRLFARGPTTAQPGPAALHFPTAGVLDPLRLLVGLGQRVQARGGGLHEHSRVLAISDPPGADHVQLQLAAGGVRARQVVVATAGFAPQLGILPGRLLPVQLQALLSTPLSDAALAQLGWAGRDGMLDARRLFNYFRLTADRRIVFGGGRPRYPFSDGDGGPAALQHALARLQAEFRAVFPAALSLQPVGGWGGTIGYVLDALPLIGRPAGRPRIVHALGWCGHGVALATACGAWIADLLDDRPPPALPWFRHQAPLVPTAIGRYLGFAAATRVMALQDRLCER